MSSKRHDTDDDEKPHDYVERAADDLRAEADALADQFHDLADALEAGDADEQLVDETIRAVAAAYAPIEDSAALADVIDDRSPKYRSMNQARRAVFASTIGDTNSAIRSATGAAEYAEQERDE